MKPVNEDYARSKALDLVKTNIESAAQWTPPENIIEFLEKTYQFLLSGETGKAGK